MKSFIKNIFQESYSSPVFFIAEIGVNHGGSISRAKKMIDAARLSGANAVKFQTFLADKLVLKKTPKVLYQKNTTKKNETHFEMIKSLELNFKNHKILKDYCDKKKIEFMSTPYDVDSAKFLSKLGCKIFKTASADIVDLELHEYLAKTKKFVIISTGMSNLSEIEDCIKIYRKYKNKNFLLLHCVSNYPCLDGSLNMSVLPLLKSKFNCQVGLSDHSVGYLPSVISVSLGAKVIEKHFTLNKNFKGPDHKASSLPNEFLNMVKKINETKKIMGKRKKECQPEEYNMRKIARKSITLKINLKKGQILKLKHICLKRPGNGIYYKNRTKIIGKKAKRNLYEDYQPKLTDFKN